MININWELYDVLTSSFFACKKLDEIKEKSQYFTPKNEADKILDSLNIVKRKILRILDPSCGNGILTLKLIEKITSVYYPKKIIIDVYDIDLAVLQNFEKIIKSTDFEGIELLINFCNSDFLMNDITDKYDYIIMNPPYKKIALGKVDKKYGDFLYGQPNIYHLFIIEVLQLLSDNGTLCIFSPKNYLSGKFTYKLRSYILKNYTISKIHTFNDRKKIFSNKITQEVCVVHMKKKKTSSVLLCYNGHKSMSVSINDILLNENENIIITPRSKNDLLLLKKFRKLPTKVIGTDIIMKTGNIVQFRVKSKGINLMENEYTDYVNGVPLLVYRHINSGKFTYKKLSDKKLNKYITLIDDNTNSALIIENKNYLIFRKSIDKNSNKLLLSVPYLKNLNTPKICIDNSLAYFVKADGEFSETEVLGLHCIFMSNQFDDYYRMVNSTHTINIYELINMNFPNLDTIIIIGKRYRDVCWNIENATQIMDDFIL